MEPLFLEQNLVMVFMVKFIPKLFIHDEYNSAIIENILKRQKMVMKQMKKEKDAYGKSNIDPRAFVILDDCLYDNSWAREKLMRLLFMNGRHWKIMLVITMQYPLGALLIYELILIILLFYANLI